MICRYLQNVLHRTPLPLSERSRAGGINPKRPRILIVYAVFLVLSDGESDGAVGEIRTPDLVLTKDALCRLSYNSKKWRPEWGSNP